MEPQPLAYQDQEFLESEEARPIRILAEYLEPLQMSSAGLRVYAGLCAHELARAHARTGDSMAIAAYMGSTDRFASAIAKFALAYARQTEEDHESLKRAVADGRIQAA